METQTFKKGDCSQCPYDFPMSPLWRRYYCETECGVYVEPPKQEEKEHAAVDNEPS